LRDQINEKKAVSFAEALGQTHHYYYAKDSPSHSKRAQGLNSLIRAGLLKLSTNKTGDLLSRLPLLLGMKVMM